MIINLENDQQKLELSAQVLERLQEGLQAVARLNELPDCLLYTSPSPRDA